MSFTLKIETNNDAFAGDQKPYEVARILQQAKYKVEQRGETEGPLFDANGNKVGSFKLT